MRKKGLVFCNRSLLLFMPLVSASGIVLECLHGLPLCGMDNAVWTWLHVMVSSTMLALTAWHVWLNWNSVDKWYHRFRQHKSKEFKWTACTFLLTALSGLVAVPVWFLHGHTGIGGVHGKIGFVCAAFMLGHIVRRWNWYRHNWAHSS